MILLAVLLASAARASSFGSYRASSADLKTFEQGAAGALKVADAVFPEGLERIDFALYDARDLYVYSRSPNYPFKKIRRWGAYQVYRVAHGGHPGEKEFARCAGGEKWISKKVRSKISEQYFTCAPWTLFARIQKKRRSIYQFKNGYLASMIHEYGHQYQEQQPNAIPVAVELAASLEDLSPDTDRDYAAGEAYANWVELKGSQTLYPDHFNRMLESAKKKRVPDDFYGHDAGLRAAVELLRKKSPDPKAR